MMGDTTGRLRLQGQLDPARGRRVGLLDHRSVAGEAESIAARMTAISMLSL